MSFFYLADSAVTHLTFEKLTFESNAIALEVVEPMPPDEPLGYEAFCASVAPLSTEELLARVQAIRRNRETRQG